MKQLLVTPWHDQVKGSWWKVFVTIATAMGMANILLILIGVILRPDLAETELTLLFSQHGLLINFAFSLLMGLILLMMAYLFELKLFTFAKLNRRYIAETVLAYVMMYVANIILNIIVMQLYPNYQTTLNQEGLSDLMFGEPAWLIVAFTVIVGPIVEEIIFRGLLMKFVLPNRPWVMAIVSLILFAAMHIHEGSHWVEWLPYLTMSTAMTYICLRTRRLEYAILFHILNNSIATWAMLQM